MTSQLRPLAHMRYKREASAIPKHAIELAARHLPSRAQSVDDRSYAYQSVGNLQFVSLKPDQECGRSVADSQTSNGHRSFASLNAAVQAAVPRSQGPAPTTNGSNGVSGTHKSDDFLRLSPPQQDLLLLYGTRQKYSLEHSQDIPELRGDDEILVQVLAIGLNPVDWKGADYGFSQPSYPWINGRDFAGIVVKAPRKHSRISQGDVVFGTCTDYRDVRKAAYPEYVVTSDSNVARLPQGVEVKEGAALGVAFVAAALSLTISLGVDFSGVPHASAGPDILRAARSLPKHEVAEDWIAVWVASTTTGQLVAQLAELAGLKVAAVADLAKGAQRLNDLGVDLLVDKLDEKRAVEILKGVTGGKLRFGFDAVGNDTATRLQEALQQNSLGTKSHLLGLTGLPKQVATGVVHHKVPIKVFHENAAVGEALVEWLEELLIAKGLKLPEVEVAEGGLAGINDALDRLRSGTVSGRRIVVSVASTDRSRSNSGTNTPSHSPAVSGAFAEAGADLSYHDKINADPDRVKLAYWVPNVSGGLVISKIPQRTNWDHKSNIRYAQTAERVGFEYALSQIRFMAGYGADNQHEPVSLSTILLAKTERLKLIIALLPGPWNPAVAAKQIASIDHYSDGRAAVNIVSGWFKLEFTSIGQWWLDHAELYRRSREFIQCLKGIWTEDKLTFKGDFYQFHDYSLKPKPLVLPGLPYPEIFQGGNSDDAKDNGGAVSDYYFMNGNTLEGFQKQIADVKARAVTHGREGQVKFALNGFVICRDTEEEAVRVLQEIQGKADAEAVEGFRRQVQNAGASTGNKRGMWANSKFEDLVQYNDG
ncbi:hypothetical protein LTR95_013588 [Oleoguttula sp. CCFEE 5521]